MATISYALNGPNEFVFPFPVRLDSQITLEVSPGGVVPTSEYEVIGSGPAATQVTIRWLDAPTGDSSSLLISRYIQPDRLSDFESAGVRARALDSEFDNVYEILSTLQTLLGLGLQVSDQLAVFYEFSGDGSTLEYTLGSSSLTSASPAELLVTYDGLMQTPSNYSIDNSGPAPLLVLDSAPPSGTFILVQDLGIRKLAGFVLLAQAAAEAAQAAADALVTVYHIGFSFSSEIGSGLDIGAWVCPAEFNVDFPVGISGAVGYAAVPPVSEALFSIQRNDVEVGTVTFASGANYATIGATNTNFDVTSADRIRVVSPNPQDPNLADVSITLAGERIPWLL